MESRADKGKEVAVASKELKRLNKGVESSLSAQKATPAGRIRAKGLEEHWIKWVNAQKEEKYAPIRFNFNKEEKYATENWIDEGCLGLEFPTIWDNIRELGLGYSFSKQEECNLTLVREFYANWNTSYKRAQRLRGSALFKCG
ncbi:hypothetical protein HAX54_044007 [Datura stramonium]|uniref:Uncharacterized protein n=1 Tax=Datura stramonium TaxID=4076 RepID=A0ABS8W3X2_DATST|nr:hypothetical protein [Datura stramonium]